MMWRTFLREFRRQRRMRIPLELRIAMSAERIQRQRGISAIAALAAAEAVELAHEHRIGLDRIEFDDEHLHWFGIYETGPRKTPTMVKIPLEHATEATQRGIASLN